MKATEETSAQNANGRAQPQEYVVPDCNICETVDGYIVEAEMPGVNKAGLEVTVENNELSILGHRVEEPGVGALIFRERHLADYRRMFEIDPAIDTGKIAARIEQGVLILTLPKSEKVKPRTITVE
jgi:HSP20 family protein